MGRRNENGPAAVRVGALALRRQQGYRIWASVRARACAPSPRLRPKSGLPDFGHLIDWSKSETSDFD
jgi:hypothetical protein